MSHPPSIRYCPVPAFFIPVTVSLQEDAGPRDALEEAVVSLIRIGQRFPHEMVKTLCVALELVESALAELERRQILTHQADNGSYSLNEQAEGGARPRERPGYVLWDLLAEQPTFQLILGKPHEEPYVPEGIDVLGIRVPRPQRRPQLSHVVRTVRSLPEIPDLHVFCPLGNSYRAVDSQLVQRVSFMSVRRMLPGRAYVPVEFRPQCDPIVWRPVIVPSFNLATPLDPRGYEGLKQRIPEGVRTLEQLRMEMDPRLRELLAAEGYEHIEDLFRDAERRIQQSLVGAWGNPGWEEVQQAAIEAMRHTILSRFIRSSLHGGMHGWADVLERAVRNLLHIVVKPTVVETWANPDRNGSLQRSLEPKRQALGTLVDGLLNARDLRPGKREGLLKVLDHGTLGSRLLALAALWVTDSTVADRLRPVLHARPDFFRKLDDTIETRNRVIHPGDEEAPNARALRHSVLALVQAMMQVG